MSAVYGHHYVVQDNQLEFFLGQFFIEGQEKAEAHTILMTFAMERLRRVCATPQKVNLKIQ